MTRGIRLFCAAASMALSLALPAYGQVVINPAPVPSCTNGQTLIYNSGTWACGSTTGTGTWTGSGTTGKIPKATGAQQLGDSIMAESGTTITVTGTLNATAALHLNGTSINSTGVLTNVAYLAQEQTFSAKQIVRSSPDNADRIVIGNGSFIGGAIGYRGGTDTVWYWNAADATSAKISLRFGGADGTAGTERAYIRGGDGRVTFSNYGAGTLQTDASGNITASSDARLKEDRGAFSAGLSQILGLQPRLYRWKPETGLDTGNLYAGFIAQNVRSFIPEAVGVDQDGRLSVSTTPILAAAVTAIHDLTAEIDELRAHLKLPPRDRTPREADNPQHRTMRYEIAAAAAAERAAKDPKKEPR